LKFKIGPLSFFQTNSLQANKLYETVLNFAEFKGDETVYDLYTGTGTIANYISFSVKKVIGIEYVESSVQDAKVNTILNEITNIEFFAGIMEKILNEDFFEKHGKPQVIITDPPRSGMHEKVIKQNPFNEIKTPKSEKRLPSVLDHDEVNAVTNAPDINSSTGLRDKTLFEVLYATGLRVSELISLTINNVNLEAGFIIVVGKGSKERIVPIGDEAMFWIKKISYRISPSGIKKTG